VDHAASAQRTRRRVVSGGGEIERRATALGRGAARRRISAAGSMFAVEHAAAVQAWWRFESGFENGCGHSGNSKESDIDFLF
jgi:hypothetical protein